MVEEGSFLQIFFASSLSLSLSDRFDLMSLTHVVLFAGFLSLVTAASSSLGSRSILDADQIDKAVELDASNFDSVLGDTPAKYAIVEFFAHWCPACRNYKPQYEKVARLFNGPDAIHPAVVLLTRVDCANKANTELCDKFSVSYYPMLLWGPPTEFVSGSWEPKKNKTEIVAIDDGRTAERLLNWINKRIGRSYGLDDQKFENEHVPSNITIDYEQISQAVYDIEEATAEAFSIILTTKAIKSSETSASFIRFIQLLAAHHPSRRCRKGAAEILVNYDDLCPSGKCSYEEYRGKDTLENFPICGKDVPRGYYIFCRGSKNDTRGFSCGLWVLMHSLSVRIEDGESQFAFAAICNFINNFFMCDECRLHFNDMCLSVKTPFKKSRDFVLWVWSTHNKVNERLMKDEASLQSGDPKFPKMIWPPKELCPSCYLSSTSENIEWDHDNVYEFLKNYYGPKLVSLYKEKSVITNKEKTISNSEDLTVATNALVVPIGAALAIAVASCAFGALACYWRTQQKNRKPRRRQQTQGLFGIDMQKLPTSGL